MSGSALASSTASASARVTAASTAFRESGRFSVITSERPTRCVRTESVMVRTLTAVPRPLKRGSAQRLFARRSRRNFTVIRSAPLYAAPMPTTLAIIDQEPVDPAASEAGYAPGRLAVALLGLTGNFCDEEPS